MDADKPKVLKAVDSEEDWERVLSVAAHVQTLLDDAILVGGTAAAMYAERRFSNDDDHVIYQLRTHFDDVLKRLEDVAGWNTVSMKPPVLILGNLDGVQTGIRNLIREAPLEVELLETKWGNIRVPTLNEMTRIKAFLIVKRNATRDFLDFAPLSDRLKREGGDERIWSALRSMDALYPQANGASVLQQVAKQLAEPTPYDLDTNKDLSKYRIVKDQWKSWDKVTHQCMLIAETIVSNFENRKLDLLKDPTRSLRQDRSR